MTQSTTVTTANNVASFHDIPVDDISTPLWSLKITGFFFITELNYVGNIMANIMKDSIQYNIMLIILRHQAG